MSPKFLDAARQSSNMNLIDYLLRSPLSSDTTHPTSSYWTLVLSWNVKGNSRRKIEKSFFGSKKPIPTCRLLSSSCEPVIQSGKDQKQLMHLGQPRTDLIGLIGKMEFPRNGRKKRENKN